jgi:aquaporin Z
VLGGCGSAVCWRRRSRRCGIGLGVGIGLHGVSLAFGLTVLTMAYAIGHISGCHLNPAVSIGLWAGGRFPAKELAPYIVAQVLGGHRRRRRAVLDRQRQGRLRRRGRLRLNGFGEHSPGGYSLGAALVTEIVMTMMFLIVILGATDKRAPAGFAPIAIGLCLTLIHLISIPVTNTSVNPARSTGVAVFVGDWALSQLWLFWVAPIAGRRRAPTGSLRSGRMAFAPPRPFQMLLGVRENVRRRILAEGHHLRVYVPFGSDWYGYSTRRLKENPEMAGMIAKAVLLGR